MPKKKTSPDKVNEKIRYISNLQLTNVIDSKFNKGWAKKYLDLATQQDIDNLSNRPRYPWVPLDESVDKELKEHRDRLQK